MSKQSFMRINDTPEERLHFKIVEYAISEKLVNMSQYFDFNEKYFNFRTDSTMLHMALFDAIRHVIEALEYKYGIGVKLCATSLYRKPYSVLEGKTDYNDLTVTAQTSHWAGYSMDLSFGMMEDKYKMKREYVKESLRNHGFSQPFAWEEWHWSYVK